MGRMAPTIMTMTILLNLNAEVPLTAPPANSESTAISEEHDQSARGFVCNGAQFEGLAARHTEDTLNTEELV